jgi:hypothetical protein
MGDASATPIVLAVIVVVVGTVASERRDVGE